ncbi:MAG: SDR family NAD(P)-dependent oxidoreductase [Gemmataceae bacterium]
MTLPDHDTTPSYVIIGATGGIGSTLSRRLAKQGARLVLASRNLEKVSRLAEELGAIPHPLDARKPQDVQACIENAVQRQTRIDGVVNLVGSMLLKPVHLISEEEWHETMALNVTSSYGVVRSAAKAMMKTGGSIVLMSSVAAKVGLHNHEAIAAAKGAVAGLAISAAATYANKGIRINCVAPGLVKTPLTEKLTSSEAAMKVSTAMHPLGRVGEPEDIASAIEWFLSPNQSWVTGQVLSVDGGMASVRPR